MFELNYEFAVDSIIKLVLNTIYINYWCLFCLSIYNKHIIKPLDKSKDELNKKQDILFNDIHKLKSIVNIEQETQKKLSNVLSKLQIQLDIDKVTQKELSNVLSNFQKQLEKFEQNLEKLTTDVKHYIDKIDNQPQDNQPQDNQPQDNQPQDNQPQDNQPQDNQPQDNQPHITFPYFVMFNDSNYEVSRTNSLGCYVRLLKPDTRMISEQLVKLLHKEIGTCMTFPEVYTQISLNLNANNKLFETKLRNLFGINEDYEMTDEILAKYICTHLKKIDLSGL